MRSWIVCLLLFGLSNARSFAFDAASLQNPWDVVPFRVRDGFVLRAGETRKRWVDFQACVRPAWIIGKLNDGPASESHSDLGNSKTIVLGVVAVDVRTGKAIWLRRTKDSRLARSPIRSIVPWGMDRCAVIVEDGGSGDLRWLQWDLKQQSVIMEQKWCSVNEIARFVDIDHVALECPSSQQATSMSRLKLRHRATGAQTVIPISNKIGNKLWELSLSTNGENREESRWFAPNKDGVGVIVCEVKQKRFGADSALTCYDPRATRGVLWRIPITAVLEGYEGDIQSILPVFSPWAYSDFLTIEVVSRVIPRNDRVTYRIYFARIDTATGKRVLSRSLLWNEDPITFIARTEWPVCSVDQSRIVYMALHKSQHSSSLVIFSMSAGNVLPKIAERLPYFQTPETVVPTDEVILPNALEVVAVGIGDRNYGKRRVVCPLFRNPKLPLVPIIRSDDLDEGVR